MKSKQSVTLSENMIPDDWEMEILQAKKALVQNFTDDENKIINAFIKKYHDEYSARVLADIITKKIGKNFSKFMVLARWDKMK